MPISWKTHTERVCIRHQDVEGVAYKWQGGFPLSVERIRTASYKILGCFENVRLKFSGGKKGLSHVHHSIVDWNCFQRGKKVAQTLKVSIQKLALKIRAIKAQGRG